MRWQPWARGAVAVVGVGSAIAIYVLFGERAARPAGPPPPPVDPATASQMGAGEIVRSKDGRDDLRIGFEARTTYSDGRSRFDRAHLQSFDEKGLEMWADLVETKGQSVRADNPAEMTLTGHVRIRTKDGLAALMDAATYNDLTGVLTTPGALTFSRGRMTGGGDGATYDQKQDVLTLLDRAKIDMAPDATGAGAMAATSHVLTLVRPAKIVRLEGDARIVRDGDTLSGDHAVVHMTDDESRLTRIELRAHARVAPALGKGASAPPDMQADDIDLDLHDDGETIRHALLTSHGPVAAVDMTGEDGAHRVITGSRIDVDLARDGQTLTRLDTAPPVVVTLPKTAEAEARRIEADALHATGADPKGLTSAEFSGRRVAFTEDVPRAAASAVRQRTVTSARLVLRLGGQLDAIDDALFTGGVDLVDASGKAHADRADYDATDKAHRMMHLSMDAGGHLLPWAENNDRRHVEARTIDLFLDSPSNDLNASGQVRTQAPPSSPGAGRAASPLFAGDAPIFGTSATLTYRGNEAKYTGASGTSAKLWQDRSLVRGDEITFQSDTNNLNAHGHVESDVVTDGTASTGATRSAPSVYQVRAADSLQYDDGLRSAHFEGKPVTLHHDEDVTSARSIDMTFAPDSRAVQRMTWTGEVQATLTGRRRAVGATLTYDAATDTYVLTGKSAQALFPNSDGKLCTLSTGDRLSFDRTGGMAVRGTLFSNDHAACDIALPYKGK